MDGERAAPEDGNADEPAPDAPHARPAVVRVEARAEGSLEGVPLQDLRGLSCPLPALKAGKRLRGMAPGERLWIETTDPLAAIDIPAMARERGHEIVESRTVEGGCRFLVERGGGEG